MHEITGLGRLQSSLSRAPGGTLCAQATFASQSHRQASYRECSVFPIRAAQCDAQLGPPVTVLPPEMSQRHRLRLQPPEKADLFPPLEDCSYLSTCL